MLPAWRRSDPTGHASPPPPLRPFLQNNLVMAARVLYPMIAHAEELTDRSVSTQYQVRITGRLRAERPVALGGGGRLVPPIGWSFAAERLFKAKILADRSSLVSGWRSPNLIRP